jgi:soluble lytic murein transglycosylase-like protein
MKKAIGLLLLCFSLFSQAEGLTQYLKTLHEQEASKEWVMQNAQKEITEQQATQIVRHVYAYATSAKISPQLVLAMMRTESGFQAKAKSGYGAKGLLQVVPRWHKDKLRGRNPYTPEVSIEVGTQVLVDCLEKHKNNTYKALNCYSGGGGKKYYGKITKYQTNLNAHVQESDVTYKTLLAMFKAQKAL